MKRKTKILKGATSSSSFQSWPSSSEGEQPEILKEESLNSINSSEIEDESRQRKTPQPIEESKQII